MIKLALQIKQQNPHAYKFGKEYPWSSCLPFLDNTKALLIHRPRRVSTFHCWKEPHLGIHAWCGNSFVGGNNLSFIPAPPQNGKLLCARCEVAAIQHGLPSASELAGYHVHTGKLKAIKQCCN